MRPSIKTQQLQIRVTAREKRAIQRAAQRAELDMSSYVLSRVLSQPALQFRAAVAAILRTDERLALAELNSLLSAWTVAELTDAVAEAPSGQLTRYLANYIAAMVETACARHGIAAPEWVRSVAVLEAPVFGSSLLSLRLHLLSNSPAAFRRRNIFIDSTLGDRV